MKLPPNVKPIRAKGHLYFYFVRKIGGKQQTTKLPGEPYSEEFMAAWSALYHNTPGARPGEIVPRSFADLIGRYRASPEYRGLSPRAQRDYDKALAYIAEKAGRRLVASFPRSEIKAARDANAHRSRFANYVVAMFSILYAQAIDLEWCTHNPAAKVKKLKGGEGFKAWPVEVVQRFREVCTDDMVLLAFEIALCIGQRPSDVVGLTWAAWDGEGFTIKEGKDAAKEARWIPATRHALPLIEAAYAKRTSTHILTNRYGRPLNYNALEKRFRAPREAAGAREYSLHGLRYSAASDVAESGGSDAEIASITGHKTRAMVVKYASGARQRKLAKAAQARRGGDD